MADFLYFNFRDEFLRVDIQKIVFFSAQGNYTDIVLCNKTKDTVGLGLSQMEKFLSESLHERARCFVRIGKSYIVNINYLHRVNILRQQLVLTDYRDAHYHLDISKDALKKLKMILVKSIEAKRKADAVKPTQGEPPIQATK